MTDNKIIEAFYLMWNNYPGPVRLIHKNRMVLAVNRAAQKAGIEAGIICAKVGRPENHMGCKANFALSIQEGQALKTPEGRVRYWIPVFGCDDIYVHFTVDPSTVD